MSPGDDETDLLASVRDEWVGHGLAVGFALGKPPKPKIIQPLDKALSVNVLPANKVRRDVDKTVWHFARMAVHKQVAADLTTRDDAWLRQGERGGQYLPGEFPNADGLYERVSAAARG